MARILIRPATWAGAFVLVSGGALPLHPQQLDRPPDGYRAPTIIPAGPTQLDVKAVIPARLDLLWPTVANAAFYRISRSSSLQPAEIVVNEIPSEPPDRTAFYLDRLPERYHDPMTPARYPVRFSDTLDLLRRQAIAQHRSDHAGFAAPGG